MSVVMVTDGYPARRDPGLPIVQRAAMPPGVEVFHAGTRYDSAGKLITTGGRVLNMIGIAPSVRLAVSLAYDAVQRVEFDGAHYRTDIGLQFT